MWARNHQATEADRDADIDQSDLPDTIKDLLKQIRDLKEQLLKKEQELREAMSDDALGDRQREAKVRQIQSEMSVLSSAIKNAYSMLAELTRELHLSDGQMASIAQLTQR